MPPLPFLPNLPPIHHPCLVAGVFVCVYSLTAIVGFEVTFAAKEESTP